MSGKNKKWMLWGVGLLVLLVLAVSACVPAATPTPTPITKAPAATAAPTTAAKPTTPATAPAATPAPATPAAKPTTAAQAPAPGKTTAVKFGSPGAVSDAGVYISIDKGYFKEQGLDVQIESFQSGPNLIAPLAAGDLDVGGGVISTGLLNANDRGVAMRIVATKGSSMKGFEFSRITVRKDLIDSGQIKTGQDAKGKKIAVPSLKSGAEAQVHYFLKKAGLSLKDVELVAMGFPDMLAAYANKGIDMAVQTEPTLNAAVERGLAVRWQPGAMGESFYGGEYQAATLYYSEKFVKNTDTARRFMVGYLKGLRDYNDAFVKGKNKDEIVTILTKYSSEKDPTLFSKMEMPALNPDGKIHLPSMKMDFDFFKELGYYTGNLKLEDLIDTQFTDYAVQQIGPYK